MNKLSTDRRAALIAALVEGNSIRATARMTDVAFLALHYVHYNFVRVHKTLRVTPAMAAGLTDTLWDVRNIAELLEQAEAARVA